MMALSSIAGIDVFGRGNSHMVIAPIITIVRDIHASAGFSEDCPLKSKSLGTWLKDSSAKYEVSKRAPKLDSFLPSCSFASVA